MEGNDGGERKKGGQVFKENEKQEIETKEGIVLF